MQLLLLGCGLLRGREIDAAWLLLRLGVWPCDFVINGVARQHLLIGHGYGAIGFQLSWGTESDEYVAKQDWELKFWDNTHGLKVGDRIAVNAVESAEWQEFRGRGGIILLETSSWGMFRKLTGMKSDSLARDPSQQHSRWTNFCRSTTFPIFSNSEVWRQRLVAGLSGKRQSNLNSPRPPLVSLCKPPVR